MSSASGFILRILATPTLMIFFALYGFAQTSTPPSVLNVLSLPYYSVRGTWDSTLTLNNGLTDPLTVSAKLFALDGSPLSLPDFSLAPNQNIAPRLSTLLNQVGADPKFWEGSIELRYTGIAMRFGAQLTVFDSSRSLSYDMEPPMEFKSTILEGLWWSADSYTSAQVMLCNTTDQALNVQLKVEWQSIVIPAPPIHLVPRQTMVIDSNTLLSTLGIRTEGIGKGGLSISHNGSPGALIAHGVVLNPGGHFASNLNFIDPATQPSAVLEATGLLLAHSSSPFFPLGSFFTPVLALKNASSISQTATVVVQYKTNGMVQVQTLPLIRLAPHEIQLADFAALLYSLRGTSVDTAGVKVTYSGIAGSLMGTLTSIDYYSPLVVDAPLVSPDPNMPMGGNYAFRLDRSLQPVIYWKNVSARPTALMAIILYEGGRYTPPLVTLDIGETVSMDIRQLRDNRTPDLQGRLLPSNLQSGQVLWIPHEKEIPIGRLVAFDMIAGTTSNFSCVNCTDDRSLLRCVPVSIVGNFGTSQQLTMYEDHYTSSIPNGPYASYLVTNQCAYSSQNASVATVSTTGLVNLVSPGSTSLTVQIDGFETRDDGFQWITVALLLIVNPPVDVDPTISVSGPSTVPLRSGVIGQNNINLTAVGSPPGGAYSWSTTSNKVSLTNTDQPQVTVTSVSASTAQNDVIILVTYTVNGRSVTWQGYLTVVKPTSLTLASDSTNANGHTCVTSTQTPTCETSTCGGPTCNYTSYLRILTYNVMDQFNPAQAISGFTIDIQESYTTPSGSCASTPPITGSGTGSIITDCFYFCSSTCASGGSCSVSSQQTITVNGFQVRTNSVNWACSGVTVTGQ
ncbi:MAG: hypothetical protein HYR55_06500 [Acidobacteria bacterium]|nr:hypothetical protein [Acidobacteriota bacterium]MBI3656184.1 hypothetical protein [Acidobacteriota bacterium]